MAIAINKSIMQFIIVFIRGTLEIPSEINRTKLLLSTPQTNKNESADCFANSAIQIVSQN